MKKTNTLERYLLEKTNLLHSDFGIKLTEDEIKMLKSCKNEVQLDNVSHKILQNYFKIE